jgi:hypothetical protein
MQSRGSASCKLAATLQNRRAECFPGHHPAHPWRAALGRRPSTWAWHRWPPGRGAAGSGAVLERGGKFATCRALASIPSPVAKRLSPLAPVLGGEGLGVRGPPLFDRRPYSRFAAAMHQRNQRQQAARQRAAGNPLEHRGGVLVGQVALRDPQQGADARAAQHHVPRGVAAPPQVDDNGADPEALAPGVGGPHLQPQLPQVDQQAAEQFALGVEAEFQGQRPFHGRVGVP